MAGSSGKWTLEPSTASTRSPRHLAQPETVDLLVAVGTAVTCRPYRDPKNSHQPWVKFQSAGWVSFQSAPTELWTTKEIAEYLKLLAVTVEQQVATRPDFPSPLQPCAGAKAAKRWFTAAVKK